MLDSQNATMTVEEAGELLGLGRDAVYAAARSGQLPLIRGGRKMVVLRPALEKMIAEGNVRPQVVFDVDADALARRLRIRELKSRITRDEIELAELKKEELRGDNTDRQIIRGRQRL